MQGQLCSRGMESIYQLPPERRESGGRGGGVPGHSEECRPSLGAERLEGISGLRRVSDFPLL